MPALGTLNDQTFDSLIRDVALRTAEHEQAGKDFTLAQERHHETSDRLMEAQDSLQREVTRRIDAVKTNG